jgi:hypothetical protein
VRYEKKKHSNELENGNVFEVGTLREINNNYRSIARTCRNILATQIYKLCIDENKNDCSKEERDEEKINKTKLCLTELMQGFLHA